MTTQSHPTDQLTLPLWERTVESHILPAAHNGVPFVAGSATSEAAAARVALTLTEREQEALDYFQQAGSRGLADFELNALAAQAHRISNTGLAPRRVALEAKGLVVKTHQRRVNPASGCAAWVYVLPEFAPEDRGT